MQSSPIHRNNPCGQVFDKETVKVAVVQDARTFRKGTNAEISVMPRTSDVLMSTLICIVLAIVSTVAIWLAWNLMFQNGRILVRLKALESQVQYLSRQPGTRKPGLQLGEPAPDFSLPDLQGAFHGLADFAGREIVVIFFEPQCGFCQELATQLAIRAADKTSDLRAIVLISGGTRDEMREFIADFGFRFPVLLKHGSDISERYQVRGTPSSYLIDSKGSVAAELAQGVHEIFSQLERSVRAEPIGIETPIDGASSPSLSRRVWNLTGAVADFVADGLKTVETDEYQRRLTICDSCDRRRDNQCLECGCFLKWKARGQAFVCPLGKWNSQADATQRL